MRRLRNLTQPPIHSPRRRSVSTSAIIGEPRGRAQGSSRACSKTERLRERPAATARPSRLVDRELGPEDVAVVRGEDLPCDHHVAGRVAHPEAPEVVSMSCAWRGSFLNGSYVTCVPYSGLSRRSGRRSEAESS
jgi:hypothetical protein